MPRIPPVQAKSHEGKSSQAEFKDDPNFAIVRQESIGYTLLPEIPNDPVLHIVNQNNGKEKEKDKVDKLIGREVRKKFQNHGYFIGKVTSFDDPYLGSYVYISDPKPS